MPMDIRSFFGKAPAKKSGNKTAPKPKPPLQTKKKVDAASSATTTTTTTTKRQATKSPEKKQANKKPGEPKPNEKSRHFSKNNDKDDNDDSSDSETDDGTGSKPMNIAVKKTKKKQSVEEEEPAKKRKADKKKNRITIDDSDSETDDGFSSKPSMGIAVKKKQTVEAAKKRKANEATERVEISPEEFFKNSKKKKMAKTPKEEESDPLPTSPSRRTSPRKAAVAATRKRIRETEMEEDSDSDFVEKDFKEQEEEFDADDDNDDDFVKVEKIKPKASPPPKRSKAPSSPARKKTPPASPAKKTTTKTTAAPKRTRKAATSTPAKKELLEPTSERDAFDADACRVPELLQGLTFVFTGVLEDWHRDDAIDFVKILGGRVTGSVSGKTDYLVVGPLLEDGRPYDDGKKYQTAVEKSVKIVMGQKKLYGLCHEYYERAKRELGIKDEEDSKSKATTTTSTASKPASNPYAKKPATANPYAKPVSNPYAKAAANPYSKAANPYAKSASKSESKPAATANNNNQLWVDRHAPQNTREILGNREHVNKLAAWLSSWERNFNNPKSYGKTFSNPKGPWKAALLSGPPGIGKTTTATLVAKESGRDLLEFNASDARSKKALQSSLGDITGSQTLNFGPANHSNKKPSTQLRCIIMDEVDGMGAGDRSGMAELIQMIKKSKVPIICICNDRQSQKMKSLLPYCMDLRFRRPTKSVMATRALRIAEQEGFQVERNAAEAIAESCGNDVRQVLNCLQMWSQKGNGDSLTYRGLKERENSIKKDEILRVGLFDAAKTLLEGRRNLSQGDAKAEKDSLFRRSDAFFVDYSFTGLLVQQNYPRVMQGQHAAIKREGDPIADEEFLNRMHLAAESMSDYAVVEHEIRNGDLNWSLLPACAMLTVQTGYHAGGENGGMLPGYPEFTAWMGKNSSKGKKQRLLSELHHHMNYKVSGSSQDVRESYLPVLREQLLKHVHSGEDEAAKNAIELMDDYGLSREDVMEKLDEFKMGGGKEPSFADLDSKQKAAFTREYNQGIHKSQALVAEQGAGGKAKKSSGGKRERDPADMDAIDEDGADEESEDEVDEEAELKKLQEKFKKKGRKPAATKGKKKKK